MAYHCWFAAVLVACGSSAAKPAALDAATDSVGAHIDVVGGCPAAAVKPDHSCCPVGAAFVDGACAQVGPPECATNALSNPQACAPRWCLDSLDRKGGPCTAGVADCVASGRACTDAELASGVGCAAGFRPVETGGCVPVGLGSDGTSALAPLPPVPPPAAPRVCYDPATDDLVACAPADPGCPVGQVPDPAKTGACVPLMGTSLICPAGFVQAPPTEAGALPGCAPDPAACGSDAFGGVADGKQVAFVDGSFGGSSTGTRTAPFVTIGQAIANLPQGGTIAVAAGTYTGKLEWETPIDLRGRCAALVVLTTAGSANIIRVETAKAAGSRVADVTLAGAGFGLRISGVKNFAATHLFVTDQLGCGVVVGGGGQLHLAHSVVGRVGSGQSSGSIGSGVVVGGPGAQAQLQQVRIFASRAVGLRVDGLASAVVTDLLIDNIDAPNLPKGTRRGIEVSDGALVQLRRVRLHHNRTQAIDVASSETASTVTAHQLLVEATLPNPFDDGQGDALRVSSGSVVVLTGARLVQSRRAGVLARGQATQVTLQAVRVIGTRFDGLDGDGGWGVAVRTGATVIAQDIDLQDNQASALFVTGATSLLQAKRVLVAATQPAEPEKDLGIGVQVTEGAKALLEDVRITGGHEAGLEVEGAGSQAVASRLVIDQVAADVFGKSIGAAVYALSGGAVKVVHARFSAVTTTAVMAAHPNTLVRLYDVAIDGTLPQPVTHDFGVGIVAQLGAQLQLAAVRVAGCRAAGVIAHGQSTQLTAFGLVVEGTQVRVSDGGGGHGVYVADGAKAYLEAALIANNRSTGLAADHAALIADRCVVRDTTYAPLVLPDLKLGQQLADGLVAAAATGLSVQRSLFANNTRAAVLIDATLAATLTRTVVSGGLYGVVTQHGSVVKSLNNAVFGASLQNRAGDAGLAVPAAPKLVGQ